jgi:hypothetical protein
MVAQQQDRGDEETGEGESGHAGGAWCLQPPVNQ